MSEEGNQSDPDVAAEAPFAVAISVFKLEEGLAFECGDRGDSDSGPALNHRVFLGGEHFQPFERPLLEVGCPVLFPVNKQAGNQGIDHEVVEGFFAQVFGLGP